MSDRLSRLAPLTGLVFAVMMVVSFVSIPTEPKPKSSGLHVIAFFTAHRSSERAGAVVGTVALALFVCFAGSLYNTIRQAGRGEALGAVALVGAGLFAVGLMLSGSLTWALTDSPAHLSPATAQGINTVAYDMVLPIIGGLLLFGTAMGIAVVRGRWLPAWMGWLLIVLGVAAASPAFPIALFGLVLWSAVASVVLVTRANRIAGARAPAMAGAS
jgi:hypothetical protein